MAEKKSSFTKSVMSMIVSILLVAVSAFFIMHAVNSSLETKRLETLLTDKQEELAQLQRDQVALEDQKGKLSDPEYIKDYARGNFMLSEENEQIFILPSNGN